MKKWIIGLVLLVIVGYIIKIIIDPPVEVWTDNKVYAGYQSTTVNETATAPAAAEVYIDASGSMKPYFMADDNVMTHLLGTLQTLTPNTSVYFLDNPKTYKGEPGEILKKEDQPNLSATTFHSFFSKAAAQIDTTDVIVYLITDGIMSIGNRGDTRSALTYLKGKITEALQNHSDLAGAILRYSGGYKGTYWNMKNKPITLSKQIQRPFYVIALGRKAAIRWLEDINDKKLAELKNPTSIYFGVHDFKAHNDAKMSADTLLPLQNPGDEVTLVLNLPQCLNNLDVNKVEVVHNGAALTDIRPDGTTQKVKAEKEANGTLRVFAHNAPFVPNVNGEYVVTIYSLNTIPDSWVSTWSNDNDEEGPDEITTFGLSYLVEGIKNGLEPQDTLFRADMVFLPK
ncbi:MAG: hypothetical protein K2H47_05870 [Muribaculaceae bacterium]|nr:hypothetical protein [Muribaculaceae bacterium]